MIYPLGDNTALGISYEFHVSLKLVGDFTIFLKSVKIILV